MVDDDGLFIPPSKMTTEELMVECQLNDLPSDGLTRSQLVKQVKGRREGLPSILLEAQSKLKDLVKRERKAAGLLVEDKRAGKKVVQERFRVLRYNKGKMTRITNVVQEVLKGTGEAYEREIGGEGFEDEAENERIASRNVTELDDMVGMQLDEGESASLPHSSPFL